MALHDQIKSVTAALSKLSFEFTGLDKAVRSAFAMTPFNLDEVIYFPLPLRSFMSMAATASVAMDEYTAQRLLQMWWHRRVEKLGHDVALFGITSADLMQLLFEDGNNSRLNSTWQSAIVTVDLPTGLVFMVDVTARRHSVSNDGNGHRFGNKDVAMRAFLATPEAVENYRLYGEMDPDAGCVDMCAHRVTEAQWHRQFDLYESPMNVALFIASALATSEPNAAVIRPEGLDEKYITDCHIDMLLVLSTLVSTLVSVGADRKSAADLGVKSAVTNWRTA